MDSKTLTFEQFVDKMLHDEDFRHEISKDPKAALERIDVKPTDEQIMSLKKVDYSSLQKVAFAFNDELIT